jgi:hypothetical protein
LAEERAYQQTSVYLNEEDRRLLDELQERTGLSRSAVVRYAVRQAYFGDPDNKRVRLLEIAKEIEQLA